MNKVSIGNYGNYSSNNYGSSRYVTIGKLTLYFSYETVVAYVYNGKKLCRKNDWSTTTGKHLNQIEPDKKKRVSAEVFEQELGKVLIECNLTI